MIWRCGGGSGRRSVCRLRSGPWSVWSAAQARVGRTAARASVGRTAARARRTSPTRREAARYATRVSFPRRVYEAQERKGQSQADKAYCLFLSVWSQLPSEPRLAEAERRGTSSDPVAVRRRLLRAEQRAKSERAERIDRIQFSSSWAPSGLALLSCRMYGCSTG